MSGKFYNKRLRCVLSLIASFLFAFLVSSCSSVSPSAKESHLLFNSPQDIIGDWQFFSAGVDFFSGRTRNPRLEFWALRIDMEESSLGFVVSESEDVGGIFKNGVIPSTTVSSFAERYNTLAAINTNPFSPVSGREGEERTVIGITISDGIVVSQPHSTFDALIIYSDRRAAILKQSELTDLENIDYAAGGFYIVLQNGSLPERLLSAENLPRHPRSAAGVSSDGKTLYLLVIDGRRLGSVGATEVEIGVILKNLGADDGLNFDGGGSTALALRRADGRIRTVNTPIHSGIPNRERAVATCFGITGGF